MTCHVTRAYVCCKGLTVVGERASSSRRAKLTLISFLNATNKNYGYYIYGQQVVLASSAIEFVVNEKTLRGSRVAPLDHLIVGLLTKLLCPPSNLSLVSAAILFQAIHIVSNQAADLQHRPFKRLINGILLLRIALDMR